MAQNDTQNGEKQEPIAVDFVNAKGGVGKTVGAINCADHLANRGETLVIDADPDGNATDHLGMYESFYRAADAADAENEGGVVHYGHYLYQDSIIDPDFDDLVFETQHGFDFLPSHSSMKTYQNLIDEDRFGVLRFRERIVDELLGDEYQFIVFDSTNSLDALFMESALTAAPNLIIPLLSGPGSKTGLNRLLTGPVAELQERIDVDVLALMPNRFKSDSDERDLIEHINDNHPEVCPPWAREEMLSTSPGPGIRQSKAVDRAWERGTTLSDYDPDNINNERFEQLAEIISNGGVEHV